jgi:putative intracellular protease/amidase
MSIPTLSDVFLAALETGTVEDRTTLLDEACRGQPAVRQRVERLLAAQSRLGDFLESPALGGPAENGDPAEIADDLSFLTPADRPGALGRLGRYVILEVIGSGGFGMVLKGQDDKLRRTVAIKVMAPALVTSATARQRFVREAQAAAAVNHDHVVRIFEVEEAGPVPYLVMEHVAGLSVDEKLRRESPLGPEEVLRIGMEIASGLAAAHAQGLVHRDVKPANILLEEGTGRVKITDFGLARAVDDATISREGLIAGTPEYMSPEQARGFAVDQRSDLFSLGSVLYALCVGRSPFAAGGSLAVLKRICEETPQPLRELRPEMPPSLARLIAHLHAKDPAARPQSAVEVQSLLAACLRGEQVVFGKNWQLRRRQWLAIAGSTALAGGLVAGLWCLRRPPARKGTVAALQPAQSPSATPLPPVAPRRGPPRLLVIIASHDFYYPDFSPVFNQLTMHGVECKIASTTLGECQPNATSPPIPVQPNLLLADAQAADYDAIYFCGGEGIEELCPGGAAAADAKRLIDEALAARRIVAASGMGVVVLAEADALRGRRVACYPYGRPPGSYARRIANCGAACSDEGIVEDDLFVTGRAPQNVRALSQILLHRLGIEPVARGSPAESAN